MMMPRSWWVGAVLAASACAALRPMPAFAHDIPPERPIRAYVKVGPDSVQLVVRIALDTLRLSLPTTDGRIDVDASLPRLHDALLKFGDAVRLFEGKSPLEPTGRELRLSLPSDRSFDTYASASAHLETAVPAAADIYANQGFLDARLTYPIAPRGARLSIQSQSTDTWGTAPVLSVVLLPIEGDERRYAIRGSSGRVAFNPTMYEAARRSFVAGLTIVFASAEHLMILICLIVPLRRLRDIAPIVVAAISGYAAAVVSGLALVRVDDPFGQVIAASTTVVVAAAAVFNLVEPVLLMRWVLAGIAGVICGFAPADAVREERVFAGAHSLVSAVGLNVGIAVAQLFIVAAVAVWAQFFVHRSATARLRVLLISAIIADIAWHWASERAVPLWRAGWEYSGPSLLILARAVAGVLLVVSVAHYLVRTIAPGTRTAPPSDAPGSERRPPERPGFTAS